MEPSALPLTYLDSAAVRAMLPAVEEQLDLVGRTLTAMAHGQVENPPKLGVHPRQASFVHAMPAYLADQDVTAVKWIAAYPGNRTLGLPTVSGLIVLNDSATGLPVGILDAEDITLARTAAVSGLSIRLLAHPGWQRVAILGYGAQGRQHAEVVRALNPDATVRVYGPRLSAPVPGVEVYRDARTAVEGADVVITAAPMTRDERRRLERSWLPARTLVLPVDFDAYVTADLVDRADDFVVDDVEQFELQRSTGRFEGWPAPARSLGVALGSEPHGDLRVCCSLGVGALDAVFAHEVWQRAQHSRLGVALRR